MPPPRLLVLLLAHIFNGLHLPIAISLNISHFVDKDLMLNQPLGQDTANFIENKLLSSQLLLIYLFRFIKTKYVGAFL